MMSEAERKAKVREILQKYRQAGKIARQAIELSKELVKPGGSVLEVCEETEHYIRKKGAIPAFPTNVSINEVAAHYSAVPNDDMRFPSEGVVKVDLGAHIDGYIVDTAVSISLGGDYEKLMEASKEALENAIKKAKPGVHVSDLGKAIEKTGKKYGFNPIANLTGHQIKRYNLHAGVSIPNIGRKLSMFGRDSRLQLGRVYAIEPFMTKGRGLITESEEVTIFKFDGKITRVKKEMRERVMEMKQIVGELPFSHRWLIDAGFDQDEVENDLTLLMRKGIVHGYGVLIDVDGKMVSQYEHTIRVTSKEPEIFTL